MGHVLSGCRSLHTQNHHRPVGILGKGNKALPGVFGAPLQEAYLGPAQGNAKILGFIALAEHQLHGALAKPG